MALHFRILLIVFLAFDYLMLPLKAVWLQMTIVWIYLLILLVELFISIKFRLLKVFDMWF
jgi:hypothetical protein